MEVPQRAIQISEAVIRRTFNVTAVELFTQFIARLKIFYRPIRSNSSSSNLDILDIIIGSLNIHVCTNLLKCYKNCKLFIFLNFMASSSSLKTLLQ